MFKQIIEKLFRTLGYTISRRSNSKTQSQEFISDGEIFIEIYEKCKKYTSTSIERMNALFAATKYVVENKIPGDIVECGVWKGGSMMLCAYTLLYLNDTSRKIYLYDTYEGMTEPTEVDVSFDNKSAAEIKKQYEPYIQANSKAWLYISLEQVKKYLSLTGYPLDKLIFVKGKIEDTIPDMMPKQISILRLDTDWYESTYHELYHLYPRLSVNGFLILDDYGHWEGARKATNNYFKENNINIFLNRIDYTGRLGIKNSK